MPYSRLKYEKAPTMVGQGDEKQTLSSRPAGRGQRELPELQNDKPEGGYSLCETCELRFAGTLLRLARDVTPLHDSLDATLHPGGHSPVRIQTATSPDSYQA